MVIRLVAGFLAVLCFSTIALSQTQSGSIVGTIVDPQGALIGGANVSLISVSTGATRTVSSDERGSFAFTAIAADSYTLSVELTGFNKYERTDIHLEPNGHLSVGDIRLSLSTGREEIT